MVIYLDFYSAGKNFSSFAAFEKNSIKTSRNQEEIS
jgi:hypothetical protein